MDGRTWGERIYKIVEVDGCWARNYSRGSQVGLSVVKTNE